MTTGGSRASELAALADAVVARLDDANRARERGLAACRRAVRSAGNSVRAVHRLDAETAAAHREVARDAIREAQEALQPFPAVAHAGFLHDASKEYAEAALVAALVQGAPLPSPDELGVEIPAWLGGLAEAASELRRHALDRLREGDLRRGEELLGAMDDVYEMLITLDYPDAVTGGLRRTVDALRAVLERTRGDITTTVLQGRLQGAIEKGLRGEERLGAQQRPLS